MKEGIKKERGRKKERKEVKKRKEQQERGRNNTRKEGRNKAGYTAQDAHSMRSFHLGK